MFCMKKHVLHEQSITPQFCSVTKAISLLICDLICIFILHKMPIFPNERKQSDLPVLCTVERRLLNSV